MDLKDQRFGIEIEITDVTRQMAAGATAQYFGTLVRYLGTRYNTYTAIDSQGRQWKFTSGDSITPQRKVGERKMMANNTYKTEMVSPICRYEDIVTIQQVIRRSKETGAITNSSYGTHAYIDASPFDARTLRSITDIIAAKEDLIYRALKVSVSREHSHCRKVEQRFLNDSNARKPRSMAGVERIWYDGESRNYSHYSDSRYHCPNFHSVFQKGTVESHLFNGALHAGRIKACIRFCLATGI